MAKLAEKAAKTKPFTDYIEKLDPEKLGSENRTDLQKSSLPAANMKRSNLDEYFKQEVEMAQ